MKQQIIYTTVAFYRLLIGLYPRHFQEEFGEEMTDVPHLHYKKSIRRFAVLLLLALVRMALMGCSSLMMASENRPQTREMALADLDDDGDLDAFLANGRI